MEVFQSVIKLFISEKELNKLLVTDRKGVTNAMMSTPPGDLKKWVM